MSTRTNSKDALAHLAWLLRQKGYTFRAIRAELGVKSIDSVRTLCGRGQRLEAQASAADRMAQLEARYAARIGHNWKEPA